jgi:hypothetical protein
MRIHQHQFEPALQNRPHWPPSNSGRLHDHLRHLVLSQPIGQAQQISRHRPEAALRLPFLSVYLTTDHATVYALVHLQAGTASMNHFLSFWAAPKDVFFYENLLRVLAIQDGGDNSLFLQACGSNSFAGFSAPLTQRPCSRRVPRPPYSDSRPFSSFVVTGTVMLNSFLKSSSNQIYSF